MGLTIAISRENIKLTIDWWKLRTEVWRLRRRISRYGIDRAFRRLLRQLESDTRFFAERIPNAPVHFQRKLALDAPRVLRAINSLKYVKEQGICRELFSQATIATLNRNLKYMHKIYDHAIGFKRIHFPDAPAIDLREDIEAVKTLSTAAKGFIGYLSAVILAGIYLGRPVFYGSEFVEPFRYAALLVSASAILVLVRVLTHLDYWKIEE